MRGGNRRESSSNSAGVLQQCCCGAPTRGHANPIPAWDEAQLRGSAHLKDARGLHAQDGARPDNVAERSAREQPERWTASMERMHGRTAASGAARAARAPGDAKGLDHLVVRRPADQRLALDAPAAAVAGGVSGDRARGRTQMHAE